ncbi:unnamed protein product [Brugia timori]|uniref:Uncharacterized protein n=1 Tax=Brugia timori TaxID=42155 RepID=A0A3P7T3M7_9BILA|nr:unnamed protein product [Brugia timori]
MCLDPSTSSAVFGNCIKGSLGGRALRPRPSGAPPWDDRAERSSRWRARAPPVRSRPTWLPTRCAPVRRRSRQLPAQTRAARVIAVLPGETGRPAPSFARIAAAARRGLDRSRVSCMRSERVAHGDRALVAVEVEVRWTPILRDQGGSDCLLPGRRRVGGQNESPIRDRCLPVRIGFSSIGGLVHDPAQQRETGIPHDDDLIPLLVRGCHDHAPHVAPPDEPVVLTSSDLAKGSCVALEVRVAARARLLAFCFRLIFCPRIEAQQVHHVDRLVFGHCPTRLVERFHGVVDEGQGGGARPHRKRDGLQCRDAAEAQGQALDHQLRAQSVVGVLTMMLFVVTHKPGRAVDDECQVDTASDLNGDVHKSRLEDHEDANQGTKVATEI